MDLVSLCPFSIATVAWQPKADEWNLTICVKATFELVQGGEATLAAEQGELGDDAFYEDDPRGTLYAPADLAPYKPRADVIFVGTAHAPGGRPVDKLVARITVGEFTKAVRVTGDRVWASGANGLAPTTATPFREMPLRYERAARSGDNLSGIEARAAHGETGEPLPNIEADSRDATSTPGFAPLPPSWRARLGRLNESAILWAYRVHGQRPASDDEVARTVGAAPHGFDFAFFNAAPRDQRVDLLRQAPTIVLENLNAEQARFETRLPNLRPRVFRADPRSHRPTEVAMRCDTIWIDGDRLQCVVGWRGIAVVQSGDESSFGRFVAVSESPTERVRLDVVTRLLGGNEADKSKPTEDLGVRHDAVRTPPTPQPRALNTPRPTSPPKFVRRHTLPLPAAKAEVGGAAAGDSLETARLAPQTLPFATQPSDPGARPAAHKFDGLPFKPSSNEDTGSFPGAHVDRDSNLAALPFKPTGGDVPEDRPSFVGNPDRALPFVNAEWEDELTRPVAAMRHPAGGAHDEASIADDVSTPIHDDSLGDSTSEVPRAPAMVEPGYRGGGDEESIDEDTATKFDGGDSKPSDEDEPAWARPMTEPPPPPIRTEPPPPMNVKKPDFLGAKLFTLPDAEPSTIEEVADEATRQEDTADLPLGPEPQVLPVFDPTSLPLEECATIAAELAMKRRTEAEILKKHDLTAEAWKTANAHWLAAITKETERGTTKRLGAYDAAYVGALEKIRGPITTADYARVVVGGERGDVALALTDLGLPRAALMRIERLWTKRLAEDAQLAREVEAAAEAARKI